MSNYDSIININYITDNVYASSKEIAGNIAILNEHNITNIISLNNQTFDNNVMHYKFDTEDNPNFNMNQYYEEIYNIIIHSIGNVLVHCDAGVSRTGSVIIYYLMRKYNISYDEAFKYATSKRPCISPNNGFELGLRLLELKDVKFNSKDVKSEGVKFLYYDELVNYIINNNINNIIGVGNGMNYGNYCYNVDDNIDSLLENYNNIKQHINNGNVIYGTKYLIDMIKNIYYKTSNNMTNEEYDKINRINNIIINNIINVDVNNLVNYKKSELYQLSSKLDSYVCKTNEERLLKKQLIAKIEMLI
jgi:hypothetical protein